jgi:hypothetical protein
MNGTSGFGEVRSSTSRLSANRSMSEQQTRFGTGSCQLFKLFWFLQRRWKVAVPHGKHEGVVACTALRLKREKLLLSRTALLFVGVLCLSADPALSEDRATPPVPSTPSIPVVMKVKAVSPSKAGIGDRIRVEIQNLAEAIEKGAVNPRKLTLYLDGRVMPGIYAEPVGDRANNVLEFILERTDKSKQAWLPLLGSPKSAIREIPVSVGYEDKEQIPAVDPNSPPTMNLRVFHVRWLVGCVIGVLVFLGLFIWLARTSNIVRDSTLVDFQDKEQKRPYSLARVQMAVWLFFVGSSLLFIYLITDDYNTITDQALMLIGIGTGTALGAAVIDVGKRNVVNGERGSLDGLKAETKTLDEGVKLIQEKIKANPSAQTQDAAALSQLTSNFAEKKARQIEAETREKNASMAFIKDSSAGLLFDLLTDANGVNFHRLQMIVWTVVLVFLFCIEVYRNLAMPEFNATLLALMGISSGTYLGFKISEPQST